MAGDPMLNVLQGGDPSSFNPRPPSMAGDPVIGVRHQALTHVSIRARHRWRAIRCERSFSCRSRHSFNPRPPSMAGDPPACAARSLHSLVSIRARHRWRAILEMAVAKQAYVEVSIRARHRWRAIQPVHQADVVHDQFQSAPAIDGGRSSASISARVQMPSFNPRPPSMAGDPRGRRRSAIGSAVSIRARHRWRAIRAHFSLLIR